MSNLFMKIILLSSLALSFSVYSKEILYGNSLEVLTVIYGEETILRFPKQVKTVSKTNEFEISPVDANDPDYSVLTLRPVFRKGKGRVLFVLDNGDVIRTKIVTLKKALPTKTDSIYDFKSKKEAHKRRKPLTQISELDLMKALIRGDEVSGYQQKRVVRTIWNTPKDVTAKLIKIYTGEKFNGYIFKLKNRTFQTIQVDLKKIALGRPNQALLAQIDNPVLTPKDQDNHWTLLRVVARPTSVYKDVSLPIEVVKEKK